MVRVLVLLIGMSLLTPLSVFGGEAFAAHKGKKTEEGIEFEPACPQARNTPTAPEEFLRMNNPLEVSRANLFAGQTLFHFDAEPGPCRVCHGISGNGLHTNGYTLARKVLLEAFEIDQYHEPLQGSVADELLKIHPNYYPLIQKVTDAFPVKGISHITGGGIEKNTRRLLQDGLQLNVNWGNWPVPPVFDLIQQTGGVPVEDMRQTFNMGIGLIFIIDPQYKEDLLKHGKLFPYQFYHIGMVE